MACGRIVCLNGASLATGRIAPKYDGLAITQRLRDRGRCVGGGGGTVGGAVSRLWSAFVTFRAVL
jgi:hypothetical protein